MAVGLLTSTQWQLQLLAPLPPCCAGKRRHILLFCSSHRLLKLSGGIWHKHCSSSADDHLTLNQISLPLPPLSKRIKNKSENKMLLLFLFHSLSIGSEVCTRKRNERKQCFKFAHRQLSHSSSCQRCTTL
uniref:Uncharacterized protein n=1 Tax=Trypanosoma vivax (strain Y486) TaxID=1055687 RepID=G0TXV1_TRYVY|nr:conserved hypothetical protein [Trypanosoma vivax Y486]